jgi:predicted nucleic acid-binding Zn ribbon protein
VGRFQSPRALRPGQLSDSHRWHPDCRRCLLKGCERWFRPRRPQARYCSPACQDAARRWRRWRAGQRYRDTSNGQQRRRDQSRRRRDRLRQRSARSEPDPLTLPVESAPSAMEADPPPDLNPPPVGPDLSVGQRPAQILEKSPGLPCHRPGCYVLFLPSPRSPDQRFCSGSCRQALRRVRQREARLRIRRRRGRRPRCRPPRRRPPSHSVMSSCIEDTAL